MNYLPRAMRLPLCAAWAAAIGLLLPSVGWTQGDQPPLRFEVSINGENFTVTANRQHALQGEDGTVYQVAVRLAEYQTWRLNWISFNFHRGFTVDDDSGQNVRNAMLQHRLGFAMIVTDLGGTLDPDAREKALDLTVDASQLSIRQQGGDKLAVVKSTPRKFGQSDALGAMLSYEQAGKKYRNLVYLLTGEKHASTVIVQYQEAQQPDVLEIVRPTLESLAPLAEE